MPYIKFFLSFGFFVTLNKMGAKMQVVADSIIIAELTFLSTIPSFRPIIPAAIIKLNLPLKSIPPDSVSLKENLSPNGKLAKIFINTPPIIVMTINFTDDISAGITEIAPWYIKKIGIKNPYPMASSFILRILLSFTLTLDIMRPAMKLARITSIPNFSAKNIKKSRIAKAPLMPI